MATLLLAGYLGSGNHGDDAVMLGLVQGLNGLPYDFQVLSGAPEETYRLYGLPSTPRRDMGAVEKAIDECDALVFPGGSIFQDVTSVKSVAYYSQLVKKAKKAGKKVLLLGQGVGPLKTFLGKRLAKSAFDAADVLAVRDPGSLNALKELGVRRPIHVTADSAFLLPRPPESADGGFNVGNMKTVGIAPRAVKEKGRDIVGLFAEFCRLVYQSGTMPVLIEMDRNEDGQLIQEISKRQGGKIPDIKKIATPMQLQQRISRMDLMVAMRLHAGILASSVGIPPLMVSYDPKVTDFSKLLEISSALSLEGLTAARMMDTFAAFQKDRERNVRIMERKREELAGLAQKNIELLKEAVRTS